MPHLIDVRFKSYRRTYRYNARDLAVQPGTLVLLKHEGEMVAATVEHEPIDVADEDVPVDLPVVERIATEDDQARIRANVEQEAEAYKFCLERLKERRLPMKLVAARILFDGTKAIFYFTADGRVDFRELVRDLAYKLRMRIEMMQIGVRDESKMLGGHGVCGRPLCCSTWIDEFSPVSIRMAKNQNLSLNPAKVSGVCGRLMCCLEYEHKLYKEMGKGMPKLGKRVVTPEGRGKVYRLDVLKRKVHVYLEEGGEGIFDPEDVSPPPPQQPEEEKGRGRRGSAGGEAGRPGRPGRAEAGPETQAGAERHSRRQARRQTERQTQGRAEGADRQDRRGAEVRPVHGRQTRRQRRRR